MSLYLPEVSNLGAEDDGEQNSFEALDALRKSKQVPNGLIRPTCWRVVVAPLAPPKKTKGGIILSDDTADAQEYLCAYGLLLSVGPLAYKEKRLVGEDGKAWTPRVGDWVMFARYAGQRQTYRGLRFVLCNDDDILGVTEDPQGYKILV